MVSKKEFLEEEKDCADMLGVSIDEYHKDLDILTIPPNETITSIQ